MALRFHIQKMAIVCDSSIKNCDSESNSTSSRCAFCNAPDAAPCAWSEYDCDETNNRKSPVSVCGECAAWECVSCHTRFCKGCYENMRNTDSTHDYTDVCYGC